MPHSLSVGLFALVLFFAPRARSEPVPLPPAPARPGAASGPTKVQVAAWFVDISQIDSAAQTFTANLVLAVRWNDPSLAHADAGVKSYPLAQVWHPPLLIVNEGAALRRTLPETVDVAPNGDVIYRQRWIGSFQQPLNLRRFPFDREVFRTQLVALGYRPDEIALEPDAAALSAGLVQGVGRGDSLTMQDWKVTAVGAHPRPYSLAPGTDLAGYSIEFAAARRPQYYVLKVILPLVLIVFMSWTVFWLDPTMGASQISVAVTSMLTLIAYRFSVGADVPKLPYLTTLDAFILVGTVLVFLSLIEVMLTTALAVNGRVETARAIDRHARWVFPLVFVILSALCFFR